MKSDYLGTQHDWGTHDCVGIIRDFYLGEFAIGLRDYARPRKWDSDVIDLLTKAWKAEGFVPVDPEKGLQYGDIILTAIRSRKPNHCLIYVDDGEVLHHLHGQLSKIEIYRRGWQNLTCGVIRHPLLMDQTPHKSTEPTLNMMDLVNPNVRSRLQEAVSRAE